MGFMDTSLLCRRVQGSQGSGLDPQWTFVGHVRWMQRRSSLQLLLLRLLQRQCCCVLCFWVFTKSNAIKVRQTTIRRVYDRGLVLTLKLFLLRFTHFLNNLILVQHKLASQGMYYLGCYISSCCILLPRRLVRIEANQARGRCIAAASVIYQTSSRVPPCPGQLDVTVQSACNRLANINGF